MSSIRRTKKKLKKKIKELKKYSIREDNNYILSDVIYTYRIKLEIELKKWINR